MFPINYIRMQAKYVAYCFCMSAVDGFDSDDFAEKLMTSDYGVRVLTDQKMIEFSDCTFLYDGLKRNLVFQKGFSYDEDVLQLTGYLYKYWISTRQMHPIEIYCIAPIRVIADRYGFYHTQDIDYVINDLIERRSVVDEK